MKKIIVLAIVAAALISGCVCERCEGLCLHREAKFIPSVGKVYTCPKCADNYDQGMEYWRGSNERTSILITNDLIRWLLLEEDVE